MNKKIIISMTSWSKRINNVGPVVFSLLKNTVKPDKIICNLSEEEFPNKEKDLPNDLIILKNTNVFEIYWVKENTKVFKKFIPTIKRFYGEDYYLFTVDDDELYDTTYIETGLNVLKEHMASVIAKRDASSTGVWGGMFCCHAKIFEPDYWNNITQELIDNGMNDPYTNKYLQYKNISIYNILEKKTTKYNDIFPNRGGKRYPKSKIDYTKKLVEKIFNEKFLK